MATRGFSTLPDLSSGAGPSHCFVSYIGHSLVGIISSADWATHWRSLTLSRDAVGVFYSLSRLDHRTFEDGLTPLQRSSRCILHPQPTGPLFGRVLPFCREAVDVFLDPSQLSLWLWWSYSSVEMQSVYSTAPADWATRWRSLTFLQRCSRCILQLQPTGQLVGGVLPFCRDAVGVYYCLSRLGI